MKDANTQWEKLQNGEISEGFMQNLLAAQTWQFRTQLFQITITLDYIYIFQSWKGHCNLFSYEDPFLTTSIPTEICYQILPER